MKKKYLITGGLGFLGRAITKNLIEQNNSVIIVDNQFRHKNVKKLNSIQDINGFLIGGASQSGKKFIDIIKNCYM